MDGGRSPLEIDGLPKGALVSFEGGVYELLDDTMTKQRSSSNVKRHSERAEPAIE